ncbi:MAG: helix-turn-helix domain-containing protein [Candidatus Limnocylindrales bacterium]
MDEQRLGGALRTLRVRARRTQQEVAVAGGVSRGTVSRVERGHLRSVSVAAVMAVASALDARVDFDLRWRGGQLDRLLDARHAALQQEVMRRLMRAPGWVVVPEVSYSISGERGAIDLLAWHAEHGALLVIEIKSQIVDLQDLLRTMDQRRRLAPAIARGRGWPGRAVSTWVAVEDTDANRRRARRHADLLAAAFPAAGPVVRGWLRAPAQPIQALSFVAIAHLGSRTRPLGSPERVRRPRPAMLRAAGRQSPGQIGADGRADPA